MNPDTFSHLAFIGRVAVHTQFVQAGTEIVDRFQLQTPFGMSAPVYFLIHRGIKFVAFSRHGENGYHTSAPFVNSRANIWALKELGIQRILSFSSPGSLVTDIKVGDLVIPEDVIDETKKRPCTFFEGTGLGFIRQNPLFCPDIRNALVQVAKNTKLPLVESGVYVCTEGPRLETASEIKKYRLFGGDLVGETLVPEVFLARELEICYGALCIVSNLAEGIVNKPMVPDRLFQGLLSQEEEERLSFVEDIWAHLAIETISTLAGKETTCICQHSMEFYKRRGDIGMDFREWIIPRQ